ncbi:hypothetical protein DM01DRAFT_1338192 [Hesseltinella vesiculosa]|uniref:CENP-V/GFA domain-containing protein n=1 Tax=Hesseltinella vesiculosa TaxID=101127 RepID=A0A1X2GB07_9FUNG|nr:hypothetical protein DM01DRAFT_1338192 [Hesseltinella vesiculosa]
MSISEYRFHTKTAVYYFCQTCGISPYHRPRCDPENQMSVNFRCIDSDTIESFTIEPVDGKNWE